MNKTLFFASTAKGLELLLVDELKALGASDVREKLAGVEFRADIEIALKACLWSRLANRILLPLATFEATTAEALYQGAQEIKWSTHFSPEQTFAINVVSSQSVLSHTLFCAQKVKDAVVDQFRAEFGHRPNVAREKPDIAIHIYIHKDQVRISLDLSGESLHKRSYRLSSGVAPIKETLAAGILIRANYPEIAQMGGALVDPMCGSGTFLIEGAMIASNMAPGLMRSYFGFLAWKQFDPSLWEKLVSDAKEKFETGLQSLPLIEGYDHDRHAIAQAFENIERAGFTGKIHVEKRALDEFAPNPKAAPGLVIVNPPYGERLGEVESLKDLYRLLGNRFREFTGWKAGVFTGNPDLGKVMGIRAIKYYQLFNGKLPCKLLKFDLQEKYYLNIPQKT